MDFQLQTFVFCGFTSTEICIFLDNFDSNEIFYRFFLLMFVIPVISIDFLVLINFYIRYHLCQLSFPVIEVLVLSVFSARISFFVYVCVVNIYHVCIFYFEIVLLHM